MTAALLEPMLPMTDDQDKPKSISVKLLTDVVESARIVSAYRGETMTELLSDMLRPLLAKMEAEEVVRRNKPPKRKGGPKA